VSGQVGLASCVGTRYLPDLLAHAVYQHPSLIECDPFTARYTLFSALLMHLQSSVL